MNLHDVIIKPLITESTMLAMDNKKYTFLVDIHANKTLVKQAVEAVFDGVKVEKVNVLNIKPKFKRVGRHSGFTKKRRKAIVTLTKESKDIVIFTDEAKNKA
ncbi:MAG: 50S ribosomal protein L23 [Streptococcaceae bacterium]|jgi:large subunit ribosomal protein L23|nr:50S ribosomal protein L23 [Streptococcaceae bacterium]